MGVLGERGEIIYTDKLGGPQEARLLTSVGKAGDARKWIDREVRYICTGSPGLISEAC